MLNPLHLRTLTTVLQTGSFAVAARRLGYTPSAVSQQIAALERAVRLPLFEREARIIRPTPAATFLATRGQEVLAALGALQDDVRGLADGAIGTIRLGSFPTASQHLLPAALAALAVSHLSRRGPPRRGGTRRAHPAGPGRRHRRRAGLPLHPGAPSDVRAR